MNVNGERRTYEDHNQVLHLIDNNRFNARSRAVHMRLSFICGPTGKRLLAYLLCEEKDADGNATAEPICKSLTVAQGETVLNWFNHAD